MAAQQDKGKEKMRCTDSLSDDSDSVRPCKRPRRPAPEQGSKRMVAWYHYCRVHMVGRSGGVTSLKHHVAGGSSRVRACPSAPKDVSNEMKRLLDSTRRKPRKWTARKGTVVQQAMATTSEPNNSVPLTSGVPCSTLGDSTEGSMTETYSDENGAFPSPASFMIRLVDMMLAAADILSKEEQAMASADKP